MITTALIGTSGVVQLDITCGGLNKLVFSNDELRRIAVFAQDEGITD